MFNLITEDGQSKCEINIHALNQTLQTYLNNMNVIFNILNQMK